MALGDVRPADERELTRLDSDEALAGDLQAAGRTLTPAGGWAVELLMGMQVTLRAFVDPDGAFDVWVVQSPLQGSYTEVISLFSDGATVSDSSAAAQGTARPEDMALVLTPGAPLDRLVTEHAAQVAAMRQAGHELVRHDPAGLPERLAAEVGKLVQAGQENPGLALGQMLGGLFGNADLAEVDEGEALDVVAVTAYLGDDPRAGETGEALLDILGDHGLVVDSWAERRLDAVAERERAVRLWERRLDTGVFGAEGPGWQLSVDAQRYTDEELTALHAADDPPGPPQLLLHLWPTALPDPQTASRGGVERLTQDVMTRLQPLALYVDGSYSGVSWARGVAGSAWIQGYGPAMVKHLGADALAAAARAAGVPLWTSPAGGRMARLGWHDEDAATRNTRVDAWQAALPQREHPPYDQRLRRLSDEEAAERAARAAREEDDIEALRGVASFDLNTSSLHVRAPLEAVAAAAAELRDTADWVRDAAGKTIRTAHQGFLVLRLDGNDWTTLLSVDDLRGDALTERDAAALSERLSTAAVFYSVSDTADALAWSLYEQGEVVEELVYTGWGLADEYEDSDDMLAEVQESLGLDDEEMEAWVAENWGSADAMYEGSESGITFTSSRRDLDVDDIDSPYEFTHAAFAELGLFEPALQFRAFGGAFGFAERESAELMLPVDLPIERLDWIGLPNAPEVLDDDA